MRGNNHNALVQGSQIKRALIASNLRRLSGGLKLTGASQMPSR